MVILSNTARAGSAEYKLFSFIVPSTNGLGRYLFKAVIVGSNPRGTTIQVEENPYNLIIKIFYLIRRGEIINALSERESMDYY